MSRAGVVLRVPDATAGFTVPSQPRAVQFTGVGGAQRLRNAVRNLTVNTGSGIAGAIGLRFMANNTGAVRQVSIIAEDGAGVIGLDLSHSDEIGPLLVSDVLVHGFDIGVPCRFRVNSQTFEGLTLRHQRILGLQNIAQGLSIRGFSSAGSVPAIRNVLDSTATIAEHVSHAG